MAITAATSMTDEEQLMYGDKRENVKAVLTRLRAGTLSWDGAERLLLAMVDVLEDEVWAAGMGGDL